MTAGASRNLSDDYAAAARVLAAVLGGRTLDAALAGARLDSAGERAAVLDFSHNTLRAFGRLQCQIGVLASRAPQPVTLLALLYIALADLERRPERAYVAVDHAVRAARLLDLHPAAGFVNAILRAAQRRTHELSEAIAADDEARWQHPAWWIRIVRAAYPGNWQAVLEAGNQHPPMTLRVNPKRATVARYLERLREAGMDATPLDSQAVMLQNPVPVRDLPGFAAGEVSIQDWGAQRAAGHLAARPGERVLDACAAPGGKTAHILEGADCEVFALDIDETRLARIAGNLDRLGLTARLIAGDATRPDDWWDGVPFDRILVDAPCSASGIARRRPDIKWRRRESDLAGMRDTQLHLLDALWSTLAPGGTLLYATCSVFPVENRDCMERFMAGHPDAQPVPVDDPAGGQLLPSPLHDGFWYARMIKC